MVLRFGFGRRPASTTGLLSSLPKVAPREDDRCDGADAGSTWWPVAGTGSERRGPLPLTSLEATRAGSETVTLAGVELRGFLAGARTADEEEGWVAGESFTGDEGRARLRGAATPTRHRDMTVGGLGIGSALGVDDSMTLSSTITVVGGGWFDDVGIRVAKVEEEIV